MLKKCSKSMLRLEYTFKRLVFMFLDFYTVGLIVILHWDRDIKNRKLQNKWNRNNFQLFLENNSNTFVFWCAKNTYKMYSAQFWYHQYSTQVPSDSRKLSQSLRNAHLSGRLHNYPNVCPACNGPWHLWVSAKKIWSLDPSPLEIRNRLINLTLPENRSE